MTSPISNNRCTLLVLDLDINQININDLQTFFKSYGPIEWIETFPKSSSAVIYFVSYLIVDHLVSYRTCLIGQNIVRLRRFRSDQTNYHIDSHVLCVKLSSSGYSNYALTEESLRNYFRNYQSYIDQIDIINDNQALITFSAYDYVDQLLLITSNMFMMNNETLILERIIPKYNKKSRWNQPSLPLATMPLLSERDPVVHKLITHIAHISKQLQEQSAHSQNEIERLVAEVFILQNDNAKLKSKQDLSSYNNIEEHLMALEDISNRLANKKHQRERSNSYEKRSKSRRKYKINDNYSDSP